MSYTVVLLKKHHKEIAKLSPSEQARVYTSLKALEDNPRPPGKKITAFRGLPKGLRLRIGDIRVIMTSSPQQAAGYPVLLPRSPEFEVVFV